MDKRAYKSYIDKSIPNALLLVVVVVVVVNTTEQSYHTITNTATAATAL